MANSHSGDSVTSRVFGILGAFSAAYPALTLSQLSQRANLPLSTTHRLVGELAAVGALERDERGRYRVGVRLWEIAALAPRTLALREAAMPFLEDLYEATHQNVQLAVPDGLDVLYIERLSARGAVSVISRVGGRLPLHVTGVGQVLLAHAGTDLQERVLASPLRRFTANTVTSPDKLRRVLAEIRQTGIAISRGHVEPHALSVAAPVYGAQDTVAAALSIVVPVTESPQLYVPAVRSAARGISRVLGAPRALRRPRSAPAQPEA